ncbi:MAG: hypothetical protein K9J30_04645 [Bacteroidales bacterium]|nr:hypothetical protein [Bacteroidales bacterium]
MHFNKFGGFIIVLVFCQSMVFSQGPVTGYSGQVVKARKAYLLNLHDSLAGTDRILVSGEEYFPHQRGAANHPFFMTESWLEGDVFIENNVYENCLLRYDLFLDQLLFLHISGGATVIALNRGYVNKFKLENKVFEYKYESSGESKNILKEGYYQLIYRGKHELLVKYLKNRVINGGFRQDEFQLRKEFYLLINGTYHKVRNDRQLRKAMNSFEKELRQYMKQNNIHVRTSAPEQIATVLIFHEGLTAGER